MASERKGSSGSNKRKRAVVVTYRTTPDRVAMLRAVAASHSLSLAAYLRQREEGEAGPRSGRGMPLPAEHAIRDLIGQLGYVGNNLNQLTRAVNMGDLEEPRELAAVLSCCFDVMDDARKLLTRSP